MILTLNSKDINADKLKRIEEFLREVTIKDLLAMYQRAMDEVNDRMVD